MKPYTVVGVWWEDGDPYIEHVQAPNVVGAIVEACKIDDREPSQVVAVFVGHHDGTILEGYQEAAEVRLNEWRRSK